MRIKDFLDNIENTVIDTDIISQFEKMFSCKFDNKMQKIFSNTSIPQIFDDEDFCRLLGNNEIFNSKIEIHIDFAELQLVPLFDTGDNNFIVYDIKNKLWCKFNIVDEIPFLESSNLTDYF